MAKPIQDAVVKIRVDTRAAEGDLDRFESEREKQRERREKRRDEDKRRKERRESAQRGRGGFGGVAAGAAAAGRGLVGRAARAIVGVWGVDAVVSSGSAYQAGYMAEGARGKPSIQSQVDMMARGLLDLSRKYDELKNTAAAYAVFGPSESKKYIADMIRLGGSVDAADVGKRYMEAAKIYEAVANLEAAKQRVQTEAYGAGMAQLTAQGVEKLGQMLGKGAHQ